MKVSKLKKGKIYYSSNGAGQEHIWRFKSFKTDQYVNVLSCIERMAKFISSSGINCEHWIGLRKATKEEKRWLKACEKAGKFTPREELKVEKGEYQDLTIIIPSKYKDFTSLEEIDGGGLMLRIIL